ncbi:MAG: inward rectifier potassium channel [Flavobacterium sp.]|jgi:inward rectifier potassium channel
MRDFNKNLKSENNTGFGTNPNSYGGRFMNKDGSANINKIGLNWFERISWYHFLLALPRWKFVTLIFLFYLLLNLGFAIIYFISGVENLNGANPSANYFENFAECYFFSVQTFTTVGYGHLNPKGFLTNIVAATEAMIGLLTFALATGLFFGKFSKPKAHLMFSKNALISPYKDGKALMFRMVANKNTNLTDAVAKVTLGLMEEENGVMVNKFYNLDLELNTINALTLSWTLVHPIDEKSPLFGYNEEDFNSAEGEILVFVKAFDDMFSAIVAASTSYIFEELLYGKKFEMMYYDNEDDTKTILNLDKLNKYYDV